MSAEMKRVARTVVQTALALAAGLPVIVQAAGLPVAASGVVLALVIAAAVTRVMALPVVETVLDKVGLGFVITPEPGDPAASDPES